MADLTTKFQIKAGMHGGVYACPADIALPFPFLSKLSGKGFDYLIVFVSSVAETQKLGARAYTLLREDGVFWICYPKLTGKIKSDITRDRGWESVLELGLAGCRQIAIDDTWSALRFRNPQYSKKK